MSLITNKNNYDDTSGQIISLEVKLILKKYANNTL